MKTAHSLLRSGLVRHLAGFCMLTFVLSSHPVLAQSQESVVEQILKEGNTNSHRSAANVHQSHPQRTCGVN